MRVMLTASDAESEGAAPARRRRPATAMVSVAAVATVAAVILAGCSGQESAGPSGPTGGTTTSTTSANPSASLEAEKARVVAAYQASNWP